MAVPVVGFDLGSQSSYISVARRGGIETIDNEYTDRCTPTYVAFGEKSRCVGASAKQQIISNAKNTLTEFTKLLGKQFKDPVVQKLIPHLPYKVIELDMGRIGIEVQYLNEVTVITPEQAVAVQLTKLKETAEKKLNNKVTDVVVNVPTYYTDCERRAMLDATQIAGFNCTRLLNDITASGITYGIYNQELPEPDDKSKNVVIVDMGYSSLQIGVIAFNKGKMRVISTVCDSQLGGKDFDQVIFDYMVQDFAERYKLNVLSNMKAKIRLFTESERLKKLMSANSTSIPLNIECFMEDKDVSGRMNREQFETLSASLLERVHATLAAALAESKLKLDDIAAVEIVGGSSRIPAVKQLIAKVFGKEARTTMNADEAVARGCALQSAIFSPSFRVRAFTVTDACPYSISLRYDDPNGPETIEVFPRMHQFPFSRQLTFYRKEQFAVEAVYTSPNSLPNGTSIIGNFTVQNVVPTPEGESSKLKVKVRVNMHGIFTVSQAQLVEKVEKEIEPEPEPAKKDGDKNVTTSPAKDNADKKSDEPTVNGGQSPDEMQVDGEAVPKPDVEANGTAAMDTSTPEDAAQTVPGAKKTKIVNKYTELPVVPQTMEYPKSTINEFTEIESKMIMQDKLEKERSMAKNNVEEYVYEMRNSLFGEYEPYVTEAERDAFSALLTKTEDWLYDDGEDLPKQPYIDRLSEMKAIGDKFVLRAKEALERPLAIDEFNKACMSLKKVLDLFNAGDEKYNHIDAAEMEKVKKCLDEKQQWFYKEITLQNAKQLNEDPVLIASNIRMSKQSLESVTNPIVTKAKPAPPPPPPKEEATVPPTPTTNENTSGDGEPPKDAGASVPPETTEQTAPATQTEGESVMDID